MKPDGTRITFDYDDRDRLVRIENRTERRHLRRFTYDEAGNVIAAFGAKTVNRFEYDDLNRLTSMRTGRNGLRVEYEYDSLGRRQVMRDAAGAVTTYIYDRADRLTGVTAPSGQQITMAYDGAGRRTGVTWPSGLTTRASFDVAEGTAPDAKSTGRLTSIAHGLDTSGQGGSALAVKLGRFAYGYDSKGNITSIAESGATSRSRVHTLDDLERLTRVVDGAGATVESYILDEEGNRTATTLSAALSTTWGLTDPGNRLVEDENHRYEYDVNGNLVAKVVKVTGVTWRYGYSVLDELLRDATDRQRSHGSFSIIHLSESLGPTSPFLLAIRDQH